MKWITESCSTTTNKKSYNGAEKKLNAVLESGLVRTQLNMKWVDLIQHPWARKKIRLVLQAVHFRVKCLTRVEGEGQEVEGWIGQWVEQ